MHGAIAAQTPDAIAFPSVAGLQARWDASNLASITASAGQVSAWTDQSGNARNFSQGTAASRPLTGTRTLNGLNVLDFDGTNDYMLTATWSRPPPWTIFAVAANDDGGDGVQQRLLDNTATGGSPQIQKSTLVSASAGISLNDGTCDTLPHLYTFVANSTASKFRVDLVEVVGDAGSNTPPGGTRICCNAQASPQQFWDGYVAEVLWYSGALSVSDVSTVETYLRRKWFGI